MINRVLKNVILPIRNKNGQSVKIKVLTGSLSGKEFQADKVQEVIDGQKISCYHVVDNNIKTYFLEKDIIEI